MVKSSIGWLATAQVFCWSLLNLSEQHSCTFLIDIFPWKHALHCTNPVAKEWALVRFFFSFCGIFFFFPSLTHSLSLSRHWEQSLHTIFSNATVLFSVCVVLMVSCHLSTRGDARVFGDGKLGIRACGIEKSGNPPLRQGELSVSRIDSGVELKGTNGRN